MDFKYFTNRPQDDPGDRYDKLKWDINDKSLDQYTVNGYVYKVKNIASLEKLLWTRREIDKLCQAIEADINGPNKNNLSKSNFINQIVLFLEIHGNGRVVPKKYFYLLDEIPDGTLFLGLNCPRARFLSSDVSIGPDKNLRASYKEVYLTTTLSPKKYKELVLHELAHTGCNHVRWRDDDHKADFNEFYRYLEGLSNKIGFLNN